MQETDKNILLQLLEKEMRSLKAEYRKLLTVAGKYEQLKDIRIKLRSVEDKMNALR